METESFKMPPKADVIEINRVEYNYKKPTGTENNNKYNVNEIKYNPETLSNLSFCKAYFSPFFKGVHRGAVILSVSYLVTKPL